MNTLTSFDIPTLHRNMIGIDRLLDRMQVVNGSDQGYPPYNVIKQDDNHFSIELALAGFGEKDIDVTVHNGVLTINAEHKEKQEKSNNSRLIRQERLYGKFVRSLHLGPEVDEQHVMADYRDGVLSLTLPKTKETESRKVEIAISS